MPDGSAVDRRARERVPVNLPLDVLIEGKLCAGRTRDLSVDCLSVLLTTPASLTAGELIDFVFVLHYIVPNGDLSIEAQGIVAQIRDNIVVLEPQSFLASASDQTKVFAPRNF